ncbi:MAG: hypothetical protein A2506_12535 [Elusimicrobia bacterium RIFOXYD12_FULL_66_9]|nr:MAG: hypothetical protein A2506_12535 [Elusimicrobia bacterium RIFOXYD12_FULL_66_9]
MRRLIVTADDFGLCSGINRGVVAAFREGIVTRASLAPVGEAFDAAVALARSIPGLAIGIHLALTEERPVCAPARVRTLLGPDGRFLKDAPALAWRGATGGIDGVELERELRAQIERVLDAGLRPGHLDSHCHVGVLPTCFRAMAQLAREYRIPYLRLPVGPLSLEPWGGAPELVRRSLLLAGIGSWARILKGRLPAGEIRCADQVTGLRHSGSLDKRLLMDILRHLPDGDTELICHPGLADIAARERYGHWHYDWDRELGALTDPEVRGFIARESIHLTSSLENSSREGPQD